jgi:steroid 5-alpha reductase family enzyme
MIQIYFNALILIINMMSVLWIVSILIKNVSIVDLFWGLGFVMTNTYYYFATKTFYPVQTILFVMVLIWGVRLSAYLAWRNIGKGEDFRYQEFRRKYGDKNYRWISFFQTFLLQGVLMWIISVTLLGVNMYASPHGLTFLDYIGIFVWLTGLFFEAGGDYQLAKFKSDIKNKGKVLNTGLWRYTRHPNYFGDSAVWWGYGLLCLSAGSYLPVIGSILMTLLIIKVSGVALLEKTIKDRKPEYAEYIRKTSSFIPWFPKK